MDSAHATSAACTSMAASCTENASSACIGSVPLTRDSPSLGASVSGTRPCSRSTSAAGRPAGGSPAPRSRPSPISGCARWASWARSPEAPTEPLPGITGSRPRSSSSSRRAGSSTRTPEYPAASVRARSMSSARTTSSSSGAPVAAACERTIAPCSVVRSCLPHRSVGQRAEAGVHPVHRRIAADRVQHDRTAHLHAFCHVGGEPDADLAARHRHDILDRQRAAVHHDFIHGRQPARPGAAAIIRPRPKCHAPTVGAGPAQRETS